MANLEAKMTIAIDASNALEFIEQFERMRAALARIAKWHGELPAMGCGTYYGSNNSERDYMRAVAGEAMGLYDGGWIYEDELPDGYPYGAMFPFSKVDGVRLFPASVAPWL